MADSKPIASMTEDEFLAATVRPLNWGDMGSSARDLWEERVRRSYRRMVGRVAAEEAEAAADTRPLDPEPWSCGFRGDGSEDRYSWRRGSRSAAFAMRFQPREGYCQSRLRYEREARA